eukprot:TRINITY_DN4906_c0_g2_i1.p1 TRINITY_DN4906_c0_g2~~TRINITY_DN4906_c0_g2_i1.p1  ORF type:complete len:138 (-),score=13.11 TRINITY_DN4906_c0_g2_i1:56-469(-)
MFCENEYQPLPLRVCKTLLVKKLITSKECAWVVKWLGRHDTYDAEEEHNQKEYLKSYMLMKYPEDYIAEIIMENYHLYGGTKGTTAGPPMTHVPPPTRNNNATYPQTLDRTPLATTYQPDANCEYRRMLSRETHGGC